MYAYAYTQAYSEIYLQINPTMVMQIKHMASLVPRPRPAFRRLQPKAAHGPGNEASTQTCWQQTYWLESLLAMCFRICHHDRICQDMSGYACSR